MNVETLFNKGLEHIKNQNTLAALACFERASSHQKTPLTKSYLAYCIAVERGQITEAISLCNEAISDDPDNPVHYLNLGRIYLKAERRDSALSELRRGLACGQNSEILLLLDKIGIRRNPPVPFLKRDHFLNKYCGILLHILKIR